MMISEEEALSAVLSKVNALAPNKASLLDSLGRFVTRDLWAQRPLPPFDNSAMDGYAVQAASCQAGSRLRVIGEQPAGLNRGLTLGSGEAIRIFTGASLPAGADAVIMQEDVIREGDLITALSSVEPGEFIRQKGGDLAEGQKILGRGEPVTAQSLALLASQGLTEIEVGTQPRVAIVSTGDELALPGTELKPGQIYESNALLLQALAEGAGATVRLVEHCPDDLRQITAIFQRGLENDVLLVSGGVSVGEHDLVKPALSSLAAEIDVWRVAIKPGKPFLFGRAGSCFIFGLPGNPVSAFVTFFRFVRPAILKLSGAAEHHLDLRQVTVRLGADLENDGDRPHYLRGRLEGEVFTVTGRQESHALFGLSRANALLRVAPHVRLAAGTTVRVALLP
jgi:molybdopterin molybdotransferase